MTKDWCNTKLNDIKPQLYSFALVFIDLPYHLLKNQ